MAWYALTLRAAPSEEAALELWLERHGSQGYELLNEEALAARLFIEADDPEAAWNTVDLADAPATEVTLEEIDPRLWTENWRGHFPAVRAGARLSVVPPWHEAEPEDAGRHLIRINPGLAFGTGHHESTKACLALLDELVQPGSSVADIGTGSGVLALAALALGAERAYACDDDPIAVNSAKENAVLNGVGERLELEVRAGPPDAHSAYHIVVANIFAETLVAMRNALTSCVMINGYLVLAGIGSERLGLVQDAFGGPDWETVRVLRDGPWVALALRRNPNTQRG